MTIGCPRWHFKSKRPKSQSYNTKEQTYSQNHMIRQKMNINYIKVIQYEVKGGRAAPSTPGTRRKAVKTRLPQFFMQRMPFTSSRITVGKLFDETSNNGASEPAAFEESADARKHGLLQPQSKNERTRRASARTRQRERSNSVNSKFN